MTEMGGWSPSAELLAAAIREQLTFAPEGISAYWATVDGDRSEVGQVLERSKGLERVIALRVQEGFSNPNAVAADLVRLLESNRELVESRLSAMHDTSFALVLLSRTVFQIPQLSSPVVFPAWLPRFGGHEATVFIRDLTWSAATILNAPEARLNEVSAGLLRLDDRIHDLLQAQVEADRRSTSPLLEHIRNSSSQPEQDVGGAWLGILEADRRARHAITNEDGFRPSLARGSTLVELLIRAARGHSTESLKLSGALCSALSLELRIRNRGQTKGGGESFFFVLGRPSTRFASEGARAAYNLLVVVDTAYQWLTAAAHPDDYEKYPVTLVRAAAFDLRRSLEACIELLN